MRTVSQPVHANIVNAAARVGTLTIMTWQNDVACFLGLLLLYEEKGAINSGDKTNPPTHATGCQKKAMPPHDADDKRAQEYILPSVQIFSVVNRSADANAFMRVS